MLKKIETITTAVFGLLTAWFGILAIPIMLMVSANLIDYITGLLAAPKRAQDINSYKSIRGICKKVGMWLLVIVGAIIDRLIVYASDIVGITVPFTFLVACIVAIWIICSEILSILENLIDIGIAIPGFLEPLVRNIKSQAEQKFTYENRHDTEGDK